jgi:hypothetical protein
MGNLNFDKHHVEKRHDKRYQGIFFMFVVVAVMLGLILAFNIRSEVTGQSIFDEISKLFGGNEKSVGIGISEEELGPEPFDSVTINKKTEWFPVAISSKLLLVDPYVQSLSPGTFYDWYNTLSAYEMFEMNDLQNYAKKNYGSVQKLISAYKGKTIVFNNNAITTFDNFKKAWTAAEDGSILLSPSEDGQGYVVLHLIGSRTNIPIEHITKDMATRIAALESYINLEYGNNAIIPANNYLSISKDGVIKEGILPGDDVPAAGHSSVAVIGGGKIGHHVCYMMQKVQPGGGISAPGTLEADTINKKPEWFTVTISSKLLLVDPYTQSLSTGTFYDWYNTLSAYEMFEMNDLQKYAVENYGGLQSLVNAYKGKTIVFNNNLISISNSFSEAYNSAGAGSIILTPHQIDNLGYHVIHLIGSTTNQPVEHLTKDMVTRRTALESYINKKYGSYSGIPANHFLAISREGIIKEGIGSGLDSAELFHSEFCYEGAKLYHIICDVNVN